MTTLSFAALREANDARQKEWDDADEKLTLAFKGNELAGECGEVCNVIKKLERATLGLRGSRASVIDLADELADVVICADLIARKVGILLDRAIIRKFNITSIANELDTRLMEEEWPSSACHLPKN